MSAATANYGKHFSIKPFPFNTTSTDQARMVREHPAAGKILGDGVTSPAPAANFKVEMECGLGENVGSGTTLWTWIAGWSATSKRTRRRRPP